MNKYRAKALPCTNQFLTSWQRTAISEATNYLNHHGARNVSPKLIWSHIDRAYVIAYWSNHDNEIPHSLCHDFIRGHESGRVYGHPTSGFTVGGGVHYIVPPYYRGGEYHPHPSILAWNDRTIPKLINARASSAIIADALEEAGCTDKDILLLFRRPIPHPEEWIYST